MATLKETVQTRIMDDMIRAVTGGSKDESQWKVLVVDHTAMRIMNSSIRMYDVTDAGVTIVENLAQNRQPLRTFEAIYFVSPTDDSIERIVKDFTPGKQRYKAAHIFTTSPCPDNLFRKLTSSDIAKHIKRFTELNLDFLTVESNVFSLDRPLEFYNLFSPNAQDKDATMAAVAEQLATLCVTLQENPYVAYVPTDRTNKLALALQARLDQFVAQQELSASQPNRGQLLIVDRSTDVTSPLLHELTYQAMAYDLLALPDDIFRFKGTAGEKMAILGETDNLWTTMRHMHLADATAHLDAAFKDFRATSKAVKSGAGNNMKDLQVMMKAAPQLAEQGAKFELHLELNGTLQRIERETNLDDLCIAEQNMVMGEDGEGQKKNPLLNIIQMLQNPQVPLNNKIRLLALYVIIKEKGISTSDMEKLFSQAQVTPSTPNSRAISNMDLLDVTVNTDAPRPKKPIKRKQRSLADTYVTSRWTPVLKDLLEDLADGKVDKSTVTYVRDTPPKQTAANASTAPVSARTKPVWAKGNKNTAAKEEKAAQFSGPRIIVYVAGGMTMSEMRVAAEVMKATNRQIIIGSSTRMLPELFLANLDNLRNAPQVAYPALDPSLAK